MPDLCDLRCVPCREGAAALKGEALRGYHAHVPAWEVVDEHHLARTFTFGDFAGALAFVNRIGAVAEAEGHHPDIRLSWGRVTVEVHTHKIDALTESDFVLAAKVSRLWEQRR